MCWDVELWDVGVGMAVSSGGAQVWKMGLAKGDAGGWEILCASTLIISTVQCQELCTCCQATPREASS